MGYWMYLCRTIVVASDFQGRRSKDGSIGYPCTATSSTGTSRHDTPRPPDARQLCVVLNVLPAPAIRQKQAQAYAQNQSSNAAAAAAAAAMANVSQVGVLGVKGIPYQGDQMAKIVDVLGTPDRESLVSFCGHPRARVRPEFESLLMGWLAGYDR
jgi:hypothetical protein